MSQKIVTLSAAATDVLYALFFRGALQSGDLPAKSGAAELRELGFAETRHTATEYQEENYFTFLTAKGQAFAIEHLVNTRFGVKQYRSAINIGVELDTSDAQKALDELGDKIRNTEPLNVLFGAVFIKEAMISDGIVSANYNVKLNINNDGKEHAAGMAVGVEGDHSKVIVEADHFAVVQNAESVIRNAIENIRQSRAFEQLLEASQAQQAEALAAAVRDEVARQCQPGGSIWVQLRGR